MRLHDSRDLHYIQNVDAREPESLPIGAPVADCGPARSPRRDTLDGRFVSLVPFDPERDAPELFRVSHGSRDVEALWTYMPYGPFASEADLRVWMEGCANSDDPLFFSVIERATRRPVGVVSFLAIVPARRSIELGHIWYAPRCQRTDTNTEAVYLLLEAAFELGYRRVEWKCDSLNARSRAAALRLGFTFEGTFRKHAIVKGRNRDTTWFSLLDDEWPRARTALERWLALDTAQRPSLASLRELGGA